MAPFKRNSTPPSWAIGLLLALTLAGACTALPLAPSEPAAAASSGATGLKCLFIGHSFFVPIAKKLPHLAAAAGLVNHKQTEVFSGGASGTPLALWNNEAKSDAIKKELDTGDVEFFGMTFEGSAPTTEGYERWIEYALSKNKDTMFMVGIPWKDFPAAVDTATYTAAYRAGISQLPAFFADLRAKFPGATIVENVYGTAAVELRLMYDAGATGADVLAMTGDKATSIFTDRKGHGGTILLDLSSLLFLNRIYGVDLAAVAGDLGWSTDLKAVATSILDADAAGNFCAPSDLACPGDTTGGTTTVAATTAPTCADDDKAFAALAALRGRDGVSSCQVLRTRRGRAYCTAEDVQAACCLSCSAPWNPAPADVAAGEQPLTEAAERPAAPTDVAGMTAATCADDDDALKEIAFEYGVRGITGCADVRSRKGKRYCNNLRVKQACCISC